MSEIRTQPNVNDRLEKLAVDLETNTEATHYNRDAIDKLTGKVETVEKNTADIVDFFVAAKGAFKFLGWMGTLVKWLGYVGSAFGALYGAIHLAKTGINPTDITPK